MCGCARMRHVWVCEDEACVGGGEVCMGVWVRMRDVWVWHMWMCGW